jgi:hypothetical protein
MMFLQDQKKPGLIEPLPTYYGAQLVTQQWGFGLEGPCDIYSARTDGEMDTGDPYLTAYFLRTQHDGKEGHALLLVNKNPTTAYRLQCCWKHAPRGYLSKRLLGTWKWTSYSSQQYRWHAAQAHGFPLWNKPPVECFCQAHIQPAPHGLLTWIFHTNRDEEAAKDDEARRTMNSNVPAFAGMTWLVSPHCPRKSSSSTQHSSVFAASAVDRHGIPGFTTFQQDGDAVVIPPWSISVLRNDTVLE